MGDNLNDVISRVIDEVTENICDNYCKYPSQYDDLDVMLDEKCTYCPLCRLTL